MYVFSLIPIKCVEECQVKMFVAQAWFETLLTFKSSILLWFCNLGIWDPFKKHLYYMHLARGKFLLPLFFLNSTSEG